MAIATSKKNSILDVTTPPAVATEYESLTVDIDRSEPCLTTDVEGSIWNIVAYYSARRGSHEEITFQDQNLSPSYQTYRKIENLVLKVTTGLSFQIDPNDNDTTGTGTANVPGFIRFNVGDMFVTTETPVGLALFRVTDSKALSPHKNTAYEIQYSYVGPMTPTSTELVDLEEKTYETLSYNAELLNSCSGPLVNEDDLLTMEKYTDQYEKLVSVYLEHYIDRDTDAPVVNIDGVRLFDPYITKFLLFLIPVEEQIRRSIRGFNTYDIEDNTIYDVLTKREFPLFTTINDRLTIQSKGTNKGRNSNNYLMNSIIDYYVTVDGDSTIADITNGTPFVDTTLVDGNTMNILPDIYSGDYGVTTGFKDGTDTTIVERLMRSFINNEPLDRTELDLVMSTYQHWSELEQYIIGPILLILLKYAGSKPC